MGVWVSSLLINLLNLTYFDLNLLMYIFYCQGYSCFSCMYSLCTGDGDTLSSSFHSSCIAQSWNTSMSQPPWANFIVGTTGDLSSQKCFHSDRLAATEHQPMHALFLGPLVFGSGNYLNLPRWGLSFIICGGACALKVYQFSSNRSGLAGEWVRNLTGVNGA